MKTYKIKFTNGELLEIAGTTYKVQKGVYWFFNGREVIYSTPAEHVLWVKTS